jgi:hypothetical protein
MKRRVKMPKVSLGKLDYEKKFGARLRSAIFEKRMECREVAKIIGNCDSTMSSRFSNPGKMTLGELKLFIKATGIGKEAVIDYLYEGSEK